MTSGPQSPVTHFDHYDPSLASDPYPVFAQLRAEAPISRSDAHGGMWVVSTYADLYAVAHDTDTFSSAVGGVALPGMYDPRRPLVPIEIDPPRHLQYRQLASSAFSPAGVESLEPFIAETADRLIDGFIAKGEADLASEFSFLLPTIVIAEIMGIPGEDQDEFRDWTLAILDVSDPGAAVKAVKAFQTYCLTLIARRRERPADDLTSHLAHTTIDGRPLTDDELIGYLMELIVAGHETTASAIGNDLLFLGRNPEVRDRLRSDAALLPAVVEELLRFESPVQVLRRTVTRDVELGGQHLQRGDTVIVLWGSANRDAGEFPEGDQFDPSRSPNRHLAFGCGPHRCLGSHLARTEITVALDRVLARLPHYEVDEAGVERYMGIVRSTRRLPVRFEPAGAGVR